MKRLIASVLAAVGCLVFCVGCWSAKPAPLQNASAQSTNAPPTQASAPHNYPMKWFVHGWLMGDCPSPDYTPATYDGSLGQGLIALGYLIAQLAKR